MSHRSMTILGLAALLAALFAFFLIWQEYQQRRAAERVPDVLAIVNQIPLPSDAVLLEDRGGVSVNEYSAVVWSYYSTNRSFEEIRSSLADHSSRSNFEEWKEDRASSGRAFSARNGEFEIRLLLLDERGEGANFAVSANWYGAER